MSKKKGKTASTSTAANLKFIVAKMKPLEARVAELERERDPLDDQITMLRKAAKAAANAAWDDALKVAVNEWKSTHGDEPLSIEWIDGKYSQLPAEIFQILDNDGITLINFFDEAQELLEGEDS
jgi:exonuclease VII small subunit